MQTARLKFKVKEYRAAIDALQDVAPGGERDFIAGMAAYRLERWEEAAMALGRAATAYPLLTDYARYYQAKALEHLQRHAERPAILSALLTTTPDSSLARQALSLLADAQFQQQAWSEAYGTYQRYIAKYPAGTDSLVAAYRSALCKERLGEPAAASQLLFRLWLTSPGTPTAEQADSELKRLQAAGNKVPTPTTEDLYRRGLALYDLKRYDAAIKALQGISLTGANEAIVAKVQFKTGQALFRAKRYQEAELTFSGLLPTAKGQAADAWFWLARALDRNDKDRESIATYRKLHDNFASSDLADDALYQAGLLAAETGNWPEAAPLFEKLVKDYPKSELRLATLWELAWGTYRSGDAAATTMAFKRLLDTDSYRDRSLYWLAKTQAKAGDDKGAQATIEQLLNEFPSGYYAEMWRTENRLPAPLLPAIPDELTKLLPWPAGFEREKALIAFGMNEEARTELARHRRQLPRGATAAGLARLHLEIEDYNGAFHLLKKRPSKLGKDPLLAWALSYPNVYRDSVLKASRKNDLPVPLIYGVIRTESSFLPSVVSPAGAIGLMQLMPATAATMGNGSPNGNGSAADRLKQPEQNIKLGARHLRDLITLYKGEQIFAIAAYNAGSRNVDRWRKEIGQVPFDEFIERIPFSETRDYVKKVLAAASIYRRLYPVQNGSAATVQPPQPFALYSSLNDD